MFRNLLNRAVAAYVLGILMVGVGLIAYRDLSLRAYPNMNSPTITVSTEYPGASPEIIESQIAIPLEDSLKGMVGLSSITSRVSEGNVDIILKFEPWRDVDFALQESFNRLKNVQLPENLRAPTISKGNTQEKPIMHIVLYGLGLESHALSDYLARNVKSELEAIDGIARVSIPGAVGTDLTAYTINIWLNPERMAAYQVTPYEVYHAVSQQNFRKPGGDVSISNHKRSIDVYGSLSSVADFENVIVKSHRSDIIRVKEIAEVVVHDTSDSYSRYNQHVVGMASIIPHPDASSLSIAANVKEKIEYLAKSLPEGMSLEVAIDNTEPLSIAVHEVYKDIFLAFCLVCFVMLFFLSSWRAAVIAIISVPICLVFGFFIMSLFGLSINLFTLLAMSLACGIIVDDMVVCVEAIISHKEKHKNKSFVDIVVHSMSQIQFSIIAMTLTLVAVYAPIAAVKGMLSKLFGEFAITLAGMVLASGVVALVLTPVLAVALLEHDSDLSHPIFVKVREGVDRFENAYVSLLKRAIRHKYYVAMFAVVVGLSGAVVYRYGLSTVIIPEQDQGLVTISVALHDGQNAAYMEDILQQGESILLRHPDVQNVMSFFGENRLTFYALLEPIGTRKNAAIIKEELQEYFNPYLRKLTVNYDVAYEQFGSVENTGLHVVLSANDSYDAIEKVASKFFEILAKTPGLTSKVRVDSISPRPTYTLKLDRLQVHKLNVNLHELVETLSMLGKGNPPACRFNDVSGRQYPVRVWASPESRKDPYYWSQYHVKAISNNREEVLIPLSSLVSMSVDQKRPAINRINGRKSYSIFVEPVDSSVDLAEKYREFEKAALAVLPAHGDYRVDPGESISKLIKESGQTLFVFCLSIIAIFLVMAVQFNSFVDPTIVMCSVPLAVSGAILSMKFVDLLYLLLGCVFPNLKPVRLIYSTVTIYGQIGLITLIALITKHGILIVDYFKSEYKGNRETLEKSIVEASRLRFRPILMTTCAMALGAVPLMVAQGYGFEMRRQIGLIIVSGLSFGTLFTLFVIPAVCVIVEGMKLQLILKQSKNNEAKGV